MNVEIKLSPSFQGPTLLELEPVIDETSGKIEVRWENSKPEVSLLYKNSHRSYILYVKDISTLERSVSMLGVSFILDSTLLESARLSLTSRRAAHNWDNIAGQYGTNVSRSILTRLLADSLRKGKDPKRTALVTREVLLEGVSPVDAGILLRIREIRGH